MAEPNVAHFRVATVLALAGAASVPLLMPYLFALTPEISQKIAIPLPWFVAMQTAQAAVIFLLLAWLGLSLGYRYALDAPLLRKWLRAGPAQPQVTVWLRSILLGVGAGALCVLLDLGLNLFAPQAAGPVAPPAWWKGLLASFYGGLSEEILCRLFLMTLLVWTMAHLARTATPGNRIYWAAIVLSAVLFGAGHLPALARVAELNASNVLRVLTLNTLAGFVFGWLFWRRGLEQAMLAHFSADIVLHVFAPLGLTVATSGHS